MFLKQFSTKSQLNSYLILFNYLLLEKLLFLYYIYIYLIYKFQLFVNAKIKILYQIYIDILSILNIEIVNCIKLSNKLLIITNNVEFKYIEINFSCLYIY